ncbi:MAG: tRNA pseudouridine(13) synthase TruD [Phycisphaerales bacterium]|nr:tRNA pseudouridine(13) synthase TruD [Phycisphaerales bacterium]
MRLPYLTSEFPGIGGVIKQRDEDFFVQEIPLYEPGGEGEHVYAEIQKIGVSTFDAIRRVAGALRVSSRDIGYAGMKDARALTRQVISIQGTTPEAVMAMQLPDISVQWAARHANKLRLGHLWGNRFAIKIRQVNPTDVVRLPPLLNVLRERGLPNYFGEQRFGRRGDNARLGAALIAADDPMLLRLLLGSPDPKLDDPAALEARQAFERGDLETALRLLPRYLGMERQVLGRFIKTGNPTAAVKSIDEKIRRLWVSALQSELFNQVLARRIGSFDQVRCGDLAWKHDNGACFLVEDAAVESPRAARFEISPTGPMIGYRMTLPQGEPLEIEQDVFAGHALSGEHFRLAGHHKVKGVRRPLRVQPKDVDLSAGVDDHGPHVTLVFSLPAGSFATSLLREVMKTDADAQS